MKKFLLSSFGLSALAIIFSSHSGGVNSGTMVTGSPGDANQTCRNCHSGGSLTTTSDLITTNIPGTGYIPGSTYSITVTVSDGSASRFGFQLTSEASSNANVGTFADDGSSSVNTTKNSGYATQSSAISAAGSATWTMNWTAPTTGTGIVTFYAAGNAADGNGNNSGTDNIYTDSESVSEDTSGSTGIETAKSDNGFNFYPNPAVSEIHVSGISNQNLSIYDIKGALIFSQLISSNNETIDISSLEKGTYIVVSENTVRKLIVK